MTKRRRSLEYKGSYDIPVDNVYVARPDTIDREVPNVRLTNLQNPNMFYNNLHSTKWGGIGDVYDILTHKKVSDDNARQRIKDNYIPRQKAAIEEILRDMALDKYRTNKKYKDGGSIHIAPSKRGTFTAAATKHGMGVQEFASKVLRNKEDYSPSLVKKANFARNASKWH